MEELTIKKIREIQKKFKTIGFKANNNFKVYGQEILKVYPFLTARDVLGIFRNDEKLILDILEKQETGE